MKNEIQYSQATPEAPQKVSSDEVEVDFENYEFSNYNGKSYGNELNQYRMHGPGFTATTKTFNKLPSGAYTIESIEGHATLCPLPIRTDNILRLPDTKSDEIISEIDKFWKIADKFHKHGFVHKRGFLLHGPPGSGKTATIQFVISDIINKDGIVLIGDHPGLLSTALVHIRTVETNRKILVVLEDIDEIIKMYNESEVLAILDGEKQIDGVCFIATTNYPEDLDGRVKNRPSRFDRVEKIDVPSDEARKVYINYKLGDYNDVDLDKWVQLTKGFSIAHIKELIVNVYCLGNDLESQVERLNNMKKQVSSSDGKQSLGFGGDNGNRKSLIRN